MAELLSFLENAPPGSPWRTAMDSSPTPPASADSVVTEAEISLNAAHLLQLWSLEKDLKLAEESGWGDQNSCSQDGVEEAADFEVVPRPRGKARRSRQIAPMTMPSPVSRRKLSTNMYSPLMSDADDTTVGADSVDGGGRAVGQQGVALGGRRATSAPRLKRKKGAKTGASARTLTLTPAAAALSTPVAPI